MITIKLNDKEVQLKKSDTYVGVKSYEGFEEDFESHVTESDMEPSKVLGGFKVLSTPDAVDTAQRVDELREREDVFQATHVYEIEGYDQPVVPTGEIYIRFQAGAKHRECVALLHAQGLILKEVRGKRDIVVCTSQYSQNPLKCVAALQQNHELVEVCEPNLSFQNPNNWMGLPTDTFTSAFPS